MPKLTAATAVTAVTADDLLYLVDDPGGTPVSRKITFQNIAKGLITGFCDGRLTLTTALPVTTADVSAAGTIYFTPYKGNRLALYDGTNWKLFAFSELSLSLSATSGSNYDVFAYDVSGTITLKLGPAWTSDTARGTGAGTTELELKDGVLTNKVAITSGPAANTGRYLGTIRASGTNVTEDSGGGITTQVGGKRFVWNMYNRVPRWMAVFDSTNSWTYTTATWRQANAASGNKVECVVGQADAFITATNQCPVTNTVGNNMAVGVGLDSTSANSAKIFGGTGASSGGAIFSTAHLYTGLGYHYIAWLEYSLTGGTTTWYGDNNNAAILSGLQATILA